MIETKILITLISLIAGVVAINNFKSKDEKIEEGFGMLPSMTWKVDRVAANNANAAVDGQFFSVPGTFSANLNPRFSNVNYGAQIKYNMPSEQHLAAPRNPLTYSSMVQEGNQQLNEQYQPNARVNNSQNYNNRVVENFGAPNDNTGVAGCRKGGLEQPGNIRGGAPVQEAGFASGNFNEVRDNAFDSSDFPHATSSLPVGDMTSISASGDSSQPIIYDRYMYANRNSRLRSQGDPIRGDLAIMPNSTGWFQVNVNPNVDLQAGALSVLGGVSNDQGKAISNLIFDTSGGGDTAIAGVNLASAQINPSTMYGSGLSNAQSSINVSAFP